MSKIIAMVKKDSVTVDKECISIFEHDGLYWPAIERKNIVMPRLIIKGNAVARTAAALKTWSTGYKTIEEAKTNAWRIL